MMIKNKPTYMCTSPLAAEHNGLIQERHKKQNQSLQTADARGEG